MLIPFTEPTSPRYIYINPSNNRVHVLLPIVGGTNIGTDNTCKSVYALQEFFGRSADLKQITALNELINYKKALEFDLSLLSDDSKHTNLKKGKEERLKQIDGYIEAIVAVEQSGILDNLSQSYPDYPVPVKSLMQEGSNLYSMVLRPPQPDAYLRTVKRTFSLNHDTILSGFDVKYAGNSTFCTALEKNYNTIDILHQGAKGRLIAAVEAFVSEPVDFKALQVILQEKTKILFGLEVDFNRTFDDKQIQKDHIDEEMYYGPENPATAVNYINDLLARCAPNLFGMLTESPFYTIHIDKKAEELSILTQFFLGLVNIHCVSHEYGTNNFGVVLDGSVELSTLVAAKVVFALENGLSVEEALCQVVNENSKAFGLKQEITSEEIKELTEKFEQLHTTIKDSQELDEFTILDRSHSGKFVTHQASICIDFSEVIRMIPSLDSEYFKGVRDSFNSLKLDKCEIPADNKQCLEKTELSIAKNIEELMIIIQDEAQLKLLPPKAQLELMKLPLFHLKTLLNCVAKGQQNEAYSLLKENSHAQQLLLQPGTFTDYSGRTFTCTAYEYAYWAKDTHMCRMLEKYMIDETKKEMLRRVERMEHVDDITKEPFGLAYRQDGKELKSAHFNFTPLKKAYLYYMHDCDRLFDAGYMDALEKAGMKVGLAQRDVPAHVAREYCRLDRSFDPIPTFEEETLPQDLTITDCFGSKYSWFPLGRISSYDGGDSYTGLGFDFALLRTDDDGAYMVTAPGTAKTASVDLAAVNRLDEVRTDDLRQSRENLNQVGSKLSMPHG